MARWKVIGIIVALSVGINIAIARSENVTECNAQQKHLTT